jgi:hypothetical protein
MDDFHRVSPVEGGLDVRPDHTNETDELFGVLVAKTGNHRSQFVLLIRPLIND